MIYSTLIVTVSGASTDKFVEQSVVVYQMSTLLYFVVDSVGISWHRAQRCCLYILREGGYHCILNNMLVMKSAVLFVDNMEISWHRVQESHCTRQQNTTHMDHEERQYYSSGTDFVMLLILVKMLLKTSFSLVKSRLALESPGCLVVCHHAKNASHTRQWSQ